MFVKVLASTAAIAGGQVLRGMTYDTATEKINIAQFDIANDDLLYYEKGTSGTAQTGLTDKTVYIVHSRDDTGFKLKTVTAALAATSTAVTLEDTAAGTKENTFTKVTKKHTVTSLKGSSTADDNAEAVSMATAGTGVVTDANTILLIYCNSTADAGCGLKSTNSDNSANAVHATNFASGTKFKLLNTPTTVAAYTIPKADIANVDGTNMTLPGIRGAANLEPGKVGTVHLLAVEGVARHPVMTTSAIAWDATGNKITGMHPFKGAEAVFYKSSGTVAKGLNNNELYHIKAVTTNKEFQLLTATDGTPETATATVAAFTAAGTGGVLHVVEVAAGDKITASVAGTTTAGGTLTTTCTAAAEAEVIFYCQDKTTAANCTWNGPTDGTTYKVSSTTGAAIILKEGTTNVKITTAAAAASQNKAWLLRPKATISDSTKNQKFTLVAAPAAGAASAARGLAVFGSAVAMATAFLMG